MAEIELNVLNSKCLNRRIDNVETVKNEVEAWQDHRIICDKESFVKFAIRLILFIPAWDVNIIDNKTWLTSNLVELRHVVGNIFLISFLLFYFRLLSIIQKAISFLT